MFISFCFLVLTSLLSYASMGPLPYDIDLVTPRVSDLKSQVSQYYGGEGVGDETDIVLPYKSGPFFSLLYKYFQLRKVVWGQYAFLGTTELHYFGDGFKKIAPHCSEGVARSIDDVLTLDINLPEAISSAQCTGEVFLPFNQGFVWGVFDHISKSSVGRQSAHGFMLVGWIPEKEHGAINWWEKLQPWVDDCPFSPGYLVVCYYQRSLREEIPLTFVGYSMSKLYEVYRSVGVADRGFLDGVTFCAKRLRDALAGRSVQTCGRQLAFRGDDTPDVKRSWNGLGAVLMDAIYTQYAEAQERHPEKHFVGSQKNPAQDSADCGSMDSVSERSLSDVLS